MPTSGSSRSATSCCARTTGPTRSSTACAARRRASAARGCRRSGGTASGRGTSSPSVVAGAGVAVARPRSEHEQQAGVGSGAHLVPLARLEDRQEPGTPGGIADLDLALDHDHVRALVDLVLLERLA